MRKKTVLHLISVICYLAVLIAFYIIMYYAVGEEAVLESGKMRVLFLCVPVVLSLVVNLIIYRIYKSKDKE